MCSTGSLMTDRTVRGGSRHSSSLGEDTGRGTCSANEMFMTSLSIFPPSLSRFSFPTFPTWVVDD